MHIHVIGAGNVGGSLARAARRAGHTVSLGARDTDKVAELAAEIGATVLPIDPPAAADVVFISVPYTALPAVVASAPGLAGKVVVDATNPLTWSGGPVHTPAAGFPSGAAHLQSMVPTARVVKAFNTFGAEHIASAADGERRLDHLIAGEDAEAKQIIAALSESLGMRPIDLGPLRNAATLEHVAVTWIHLAMSAGWGRDITLAILP